MNTMIDTMEPAIATETPERVKPRKATSVREHILAWLIVVAAVVAAIQVFRTVTTQLEVNQALDDLYEMVGQPTPPQS